EGQRELRTCSLLAAGWCSFTGVHHPNPSSEEEGLMAPQPALRTTFRADRAERMTRTSIASWNINSVRARIGIVEKFLREEAPDILCLQETKVECSLFPPEMFKRLGYEHIVTHGQRMHHGVAIVSKVPLADVRKYDWQANGEARHVGVTLPSGVRLDNVYIPAGGDIPDRDLNPKFGQKLDFFERMTLWSGALNGTSTVLTGDFNVAPLESDVWNHKALLDVVSHTPIEIETLGRLQAASDWVDLGRHFIAAPTPLYTW